MQIGERWVEVLECGEIHPWLLNESNLPSQQWSGLAMGIGLDRLVMLIKQIDDIRLLRSSDPRIARQMLALDRYEPVSNQPATHRDMSICVTDPDMELLGDRIRDVLGDRGDWVENVELKRFLTTHHYSVDVTQGLVLLFGNGTKALPSWDSKTRRNNLYRGLAVRRTTGPSGHTNSPHPSSREGHHSTAGWSSSFLLSLLILHDFHAATACTGSSGTRCRQPRCGA